MLHCEYSIEIHHISLSREGGKEKGEGKSTATLAVLLVVGENTAETALEKNKEKKASLCDGKMRLRNLREVTRARQRTDGSFCDRSHTFMSFL